MRSLLSPLCLALTPCLAAQSPARHSLQVTLLPDDQRIEVTDRIEIPSDWEPVATQDGSGPVWSFTLNPALQVEASTPAVVRDTPDSATYHLEGALPEDRTITIQYAGKLHQALSDASEEYTRGFRETDGIVASEGVYLAGESRWVPRFNDRLFQFDVDVLAPEGWHVISQGQGTSRAEEAPAGQSRAHWKSGRPMEQVYLVGGPLTRFQDSSPPTETLVYLHANDPGLANKYLQATDRYLQMYRQMLGNYPYTKFALVENFWETGYGMPSFTLLGEKVIRMPFILNSSYPHEILHNWWGNSVFVDGSQGNWCEGLTAYLSDHLVQELRGKGAEYRRNALQKYRDYVREGRDFPLREFQSRHDAATEAVGYGKSLMLFHMLRVQYGDGIFLRALRDFYKTKINQRATFEDLRAAFERESDEDQSAWFHQWMDRTGAPSLALRDARVESKDGESWVLARLEQTQTEAPYDIEVPIAVLTDGKPVRFTVRMRDRSVEVCRKIPTQPLGLVADPDFDVFRLLDPMETPPTLGQIFGDPEILAILPSADPEEREAYRSLVQGWASRNHRIRFVLDTDWTSWPKSQSVWVLGARNALVADLRSLGGGAQFLDNQGGLELGGETVAFANHSTVCLWRNPLQAEHVIGWLVVDPLEAMPGMRTKLPHYGKYSYLAFEGAEPTNTVKGNWPASGSPLVVDLRTDTQAPLPVLDPEVRVALGALPPEFSAQRMLRDVRYLADPEREGRGLGSAGLEASAQYIAERMQALGLQPGGDNGTWFQTFVVEKGPAGTPVETKNVVGVLPGTRWPEQSLVLGAHYDH
ncbi:MAG TPA: M1 family aminopeptidase, partial [Planctomycetota bacterium]|nr:M1 family aminopeptidase [Planctomycetota bacterium]